MNLQDFINQKTHCPLCETKLELLLYPFRKQHVTVLENKVAISQFMSAYNWAEGKKFVINFELLTDSFCVDFFDMQDRQDFNDAVPLKLVQRFIALRKKMGPNHFKLECPACNQYCISTDQFDLNMNNGCFGNLSIKSEKFILVEPIDNSYSCKYFVQHNFSNCNRTIINFWNGYNYIQDIHTLLPVETGELNLPLLPFISKKENINRLKQLITFC